MDTTPTAAMARALGTIADAVSALETAAAVLRSGGAEVEPNLGAAMGHLESAAVEVAAMGRRALGHSIPPRSA